jgi:hypothetical protein
MSTSLALVLLSCCTLAVALPHRLGDIVPLAAEHLLLARDGDFPLHDGILGYLPSIPLNAVGVGRYTHEAGRVEANLMLV